MNVQSALNAYKQADLSELDEASPHRLIELTFQDLKRNLLTVRRQITEGKRVGGVEASKSVAALEILKSSLNFEEGGEIAANLQQIYNYSLDQLGKILKDDQVHELDSVISIISSLVDAWSSIPNYKKD